MLKILKYNGTQLSNKPAVLSEVNSDGFIFIDENDTEEVLSFETIIEHFVGKTVKIKIDEVSRKVIE